MQKEPKNIINIYFGICCLFPVVNIVISVFASVFIILTGGKAPFYSLFAVPQFLLPALNLTVFVLLSKFLIKNRKTPRDGTRLPLSDAVLFSCLYFGAIPVLEIISALNSALFTFIGIDLPEITVFRFLPTNMAETAIFIFVLAVLPAVAEETIFRLGICGTLSKYSTVGAVVVSAIAFGLMHGSFQQVLYATAAGLFFGYLFIRTNNILLTVFLHFLNNLASCSIILISNSYGEYVSSVVYTVKTAFEIAAGLTALIICIKTKKFRMPSPETSVKAGEIIKATFRAPFFYLFAVCEIIMMILNLI